MNVTIINGCSEDALLEKEVIKRLCTYLDTSKTTYTIYDLSKINPKNCTGCDFCQTIKPGICVTNDGVNEILGQYLHSDVSIIVTPVQFGLCNSITKNFIDRTQPLILPYQTSKKGKNMMKSRYDNYPNNIFVGISNHKDIDSIELFKETVLNCNLSLESNKASVKVITDSADLNSLENIIFE